MSASSPLRIGLDLRYLQQALRNAPVGGIGGGIGGIGIVSRNLWRGLSALAEAEATPDFRLLALLDHGPVTEDLRRMIGTAETIPFGLIGRSALATRFARSSTVGSSAHWRRASAPPCSLAGSISSTPLTSGRRSRVSRLRS